MSESPQDCQRAEGSTHGQSHRTYDLMDELKACLNIALDELKTLIDDITLRFGHVGLLGSSVDDTFRHLGLGLHVRTMLRSKRDRKSPFNYGEKPIPRRACRQPRRPWRTAGAKRVQDAPSQTFLRSS